MVIRRLPPIDALAGLGPLLCLSRTRDTLLSGWRRAVACEYAACVDSSGMRECLRFRTADGDCCWQLYALPEDDFLAWERLIAIMPEGAPCEMSSCLAERMWRSVSDALLGRRWRASLIRIHAFLGRDGNEQRCLAISQPTVAPFSLAIAHRIAHAEGAELPSLDVEVLHQARVKTGSNAPSRVSPHLDFPFTTGIPS
jgi:hypothetical protein